MPITKISLTVNLTDAGQNPITKGSAWFQPTSVLTDAADHVLATQTPIQAQFVLAGTFPVVQLFPTDDVSILPTGWAWQVSFTGFAGAPQPYTFALPASNGNSQNLSDVTVVENAATYEGFLPLPGGTPQAGQVPISTGAGEATVWGASGTGGSGYPALPVVSGTPTAGQVLTATSSTAADWQTPASGGGTVASVTAGDTSIVVGGTATNPTIETGTLDVVATDHPPAANWSNNSKKITSLANGTASSDAAAFGQIPTSLPPNGSASGDLSGTYPGPTVAKVNGVTVSGAPTTAGQVITATSTTAANWQTPSTGGGVSSVTAGDTSIVIGGTATNPTVATGTLDVIATDHPPAAAWSNNSKKITSLANGSAAQDAAAFGQIPTALPPNGSASGDLSGSYPGPTVAKVNGVTVSGAPSGSGQVLESTSTTAASWQTPYASPLTTLGDMLYENATPAAARLAGNTSATKNFLTQTGTGTVSAAPSWGTIAAGDVPTLNQNTTGTAANITDTLDQVPAPAANVSLNSHKITSLANGSASTDAAAFGQIPTALPPNGAAGGVLSGTYPNPGFATTPLPESGGTMTGWFAPAVSTLTYATTVAVNAALANSFNLTLTASTATMGNPSNPVDGQVIRFRITQGTGGSFTLAWGTNYDFGATGAPTLSTAATKVDVVGFEYVASISKWCYLGSALGN